MASIAPSTNETLRLSDLNYVQGYKISIKPASLNIIYVRSTSALSSKVRRQRYFRVSGAKDGRDLLLSYGIKSVIKLVTASKTFHVNNTNSR